MKITALLENTTERDDMQTEHGLSLYIETETHKILFDMGQSDLFAKNAETLGLDLSAVDIAVLSHGHYDHGGGLEAFLQINQKAPVYIHETAFGAYYNGTEKYIGLNKALQGSRRLVFTKKTAALSANLLLTDCNDLGWIHDSWGLNRREGERFLSDDFLHEQYLLIQEGEKKILISGCSHKGILNIAAHFRPHVLIGGFHLNKETDPARLRKLAETLLQGNTLYYTGHCTGASQFDIMKCVMGSSLQPLSTGLVFEV
jgi:7,8-dihydropterin-6-yl-methyl-4-(beta-D-ribofuranosyl)aminobenzene 5'-phosphate synthase